MRLLVIDDHQLVRDVLIDYIQIELDAEVIPANSHRQALELTKTNGPFDCVLADLRMPGVHNITDLKIIVDANAPRPVLLFSGVATFSDLVAAQKIGMAGFMRKDIPASKMVQVITEIAGGAKDVPAEVAFARHIKNNPLMPGDLSEEDCLILGRVAEGARNSEIASGLGLTKSRLENSLRRIYRSIGVSSRLGAANFFNDRLI